MWKRRECNVRVNAINGNIVYRSGEHSPVFPHDLWNVHDRVSEAVPRTNNSIDAWHHSFQRSLQCWHPTLWKFIDALKKEERLQRLNINRLLLGQVVVPKRRIVWLTRVFPILFAIMLTAHLPSFCVLLHTTCDFNLPTKRSLQKRLVSGFRQLIWWC